MTWSTILAIGRTESMVTNVTADSATRNDVDEVVCEIASLLRNVCYDVRNRSARLDEPRYAQVIGEMLINSAKRHPAMTPRHWDHILERLG